MLEVECIHKIGIFGRDNAVVCIGKLHNLIVIRTILLRQIQGMIGSMSNIVAAYGQAAAEAERR